MSENILISKYGLTELNYTNVSHYLLDSLLIHREDDLIIDYTNDITLNGQKIHDLSNAMTNALLNEHNLKVDEIVCFFCPNHYIQAIGFISILSAGAVCVFIDERTTYGEIEKIFDKISFKYLFCGKGNEKIAAKLIQKYSEIKKTFIVSEETYESENGFSNIKVLLNYSTNELTNKIAVNRSESDIALIELTNGTNDGTRRPVIKTHSNLINAILQMQNNDILINSKDDSIISLPFDKLFGVSFLLNSLISGSKLVIISGSFDTNSDSYLNCIEKLKISKLTMFSSDIKTMVRNEVNLSFDISSVKEIIHIGVFEDYNQMRQRVENMFKCRYFRGVYGTTESGIISCLYKSKSYERNCYSSGQLIPGTQLKIIDIRTGESLPGHRMGEICVKSNQLSPGYLIKDKNDLKADIFTRDGFFRTNDAGYYDMDGNIYVESKVSDLICIEDELLKPTELELLLLSHPSVVDATVIGTYCEDFDTDSDVPSDANLSIKLNNNFKIFVVLEVGSKTTDLDLINYVNDRVEPIRQLDSGVHIIDVLPRNRLNLINRCSLLRYKPNVNKEYEI